MTEGNGSPTSYELGRRLDDLKEDIRALRQEVRLLADIPSRMATLERKADTGANQRSAATWQALFLVLGILGGVASGILISAVTR